MIILAIGVDDLSSLAKIMLTDDYTDIDMMFYTFIFASICWFLLLFECCQEWERPKPGRRPDIFPKFSPMKTPLPHPLPADDPLDDDEEEEEEQAPPQEEPQEDDPDKEEPEEDDPDKPTE